MSISLLEPAMLHGFKDRLRQRREERERHRAERARADRDRLNEAERQKRAEQERIKRILSIRIITGDVKYRHVVRDTVRSVGIYEIEPNAPYLADEATNRAIAQLQEQAYTLGADAVVHAQFHIFRYTIQNYKRTSTVYETHAFGTAIKVLGPPSDWQEKDANN